MILEISKIDKVPSFRQMLGAECIEEIQYETDSRFDLSSKAFVAIKGEKYDGFDFIETALKNKAKVIVCSCENDQRDRSKLINQLVNKNSNTSFVIVSDTTLFLQDLARLKIKEWRSSSAGNRVIGIAGSNGKTTTKEMIAYLLNNQFSGEVYATPGNLNNHLGVPHTILGMPKKTKFLVLEMGSNHPGELDFLCDICIPDCGIITNIGLEHMEFFPTEEDVFREESTIFHRCMSFTNGAGTFVLNGFDPYLSKLPKGQNTYLLGLDIPLKTTVNSAELNLGSKKFSFQNENIIGAHNFYNLASAFFLCQSLSPQRSEEFFKASSSFFPKTNRSSWIVKNGKRYYLDAYNANPSSMRAALIGFFEYLKFHQIELNMAKIIIGDMNELGENANKYHREIGEFLNEQKIVDPVFIGRFAEEYGAGFVGKAHCFKSVGEFREQLWPNISQGVDYFFLKASRSLQLESLLDITH